MTLLSWDEIGERHPHIYGDPEVHGEKASDGDGEGVGWAAAYLAYDRPGSHDEEQDGHSWDLSFHEERVHPRHIDHARHDPGDSRVAHAREGYHTNPDQVPPLVLVHRHGVYQVADGHHRAEGAHQVDTPVRAYVAYSPHEDEPFHQYEDEDGRDRAPFHGAEPHPGVAEHRKEQLRFHASTVPRRQVTAAQDDDYRMQHESPDPESGAPMHDIESMMPDVHEHPEYYRHGTAGEDEALYHIRRVRGNPEARVRIYRALPAEHAHKGFRTGDWVSPSKEYARQHAMVGDESGHDDWPVIQTTVAARHLFNAGDPTEFGYHGPSRETAQVAFKGGRNQEVRQHADGVVRKVVRRENPIKGYSFTSEDHRDYDEHMRGAAPHGAVHAWAPNGGSAGHIKFGPQGHEVHVEPEHQHVADELERRMRMKMPKEASVDRIAVLQGFNSGGRLRSVASYPGPRLQVYAHVSGNSIDVLHCFAGDVEYLTIDGPKTFAETVGTLQWVLSSVDGPREGQWIKVPIRQYGEQEIWELTVRRNRRTKIIRTTAGHRWLVGRIDRYRTVTTDNLLPGHRLAHLRHHKSPDDEISRDAIRQGIMFGDGSIAQRDYGQGTYGYITLWGEKAKDLGEFFDEIAPSTPVERENGLTGLRYSSGMAGWTKALPPLHDASHKLRGWLMGYIATDGDVDQHGKVSISSASIENLKHVRNVAMHLGIGTYGIVSKQRMGFGGESTIHSVAFASEDLDSSWLLRQAHRDAFDAAPHKSGRFGWTVVSVRNTNQIEPVYCAEVPESESFALADNIWTKNCPFCGSGAVFARSDGTIEDTFCTAVFTVQVQPQFAAFPQTAEQMPYQWPGRPGPDQLAGGGDGAMGGFPGPIAGEQDQGTEESGPEDGNPFGSSDDAGESDGDAGEGPADKDAPNKAQVGGKDKPPFGKKSYRTAAGHQLDGPDYLRHLAIGHARRRGEVARLVRDSR